MAIVEGASTGLDPNPRRTNSLAFASTDCHKCTSDGIACDRSRPRCSTCVTKGLKCPGFVTPLSWDHRRMLVARPVSDTPSNDDETSTGATQSSKSQSNTDSNGQKKFRFVDRPATKRRRVTSPPAAQAARMQKLTTDVLVVEQPILSTTTINFPDSTAEQHVFEGQAVNPSLNEAPFTVGGIDTLPSDVTAMESNPTAQFHHSFVPGSTSTDFDPDLSSDELVEGVRSVDASDSSQYSMEIGDEFSFPQDANSVPVSTTVPAGGSLPTLSYDSRAMFDSSIGLTTLHGLQGMAHQDQRHGSSITQPYSSQNISLCVPPSMEPFYDILLNMYDSELCILPITYDMKINPFRCRKETPRGSRLLYHSIMALSYQHLNYTTSSWPKEASEHRRRAGEEFSLALANLHSGSSPLHLLDSILIMFTLECTLSASGPWTYHLMQAVTVLEAAGGVAALQNARVRSQVAMLLWWDATLALVSRQGLVIHSSYYEYLFQHEQRDEWSFYGLSGCPTVLFRLLVDLAQLAAQQEIAQNMKWLKFDPSAVYKVEKQLHEVILDDGTYRRGGRQSPTKRNTTSGFCVDIDDEASFDHCAEEEDVNRESDTYHCLEAWRHGLLTYTYRVFMLDRTKQSPKPADTRKAPSQLWAATGRQSPVPCRTSTLHEYPNGKRGARRMLLRSARETLNHIRSVRQSSQTQKQLLLPVFWAGSETSDPELRDYARSYCVWWADKSRYQMFSSVPGVFSEIWAQLDKVAGLPNGTGTPWWGTVIDQKTKGGPGFQKSGIHFLFG